MANYHVYQFRKDIQSNWESSNPVLRAAEPGFDLTNNRLKMGNGTTPWKALPYIGPEIVDDLTTGGSDKVLSAEQGKKLKGLIESGGTEVIDNLTSNSTTAALSAAQGKVLKEIVDETVSNVNTKIDSFGTFGMGYTVDETNGASKPTKITFEDGVVATLEWNGTRLDKITSSTGETVKIKYNTDGLIVGREVTRS